MTSCPCPNSLTSASCASPFFTLHGYGNAVVNSALCLSLQTCCVVLYILPLCLLWLCLCSSGAGADFVMMGGMLAGHDQCSGEVIEKNGKKYKLFYGMSSDTAMKKYTGGVAEYRWDSDTETRSNTCESFILASSVLLWEFLFFWLLTVTVYYYRHTLITQVFATFFFLLNPFHTLMIHNTDKRILELQKLPL